MHWWDNMDIHFSYQRLCRCYLDLGCGVSGEIGEKWKQKSSSWVL